MCGCEWAWLRRHAGELGIVLIRVGTKAFAPADQVLAAFEKMRPPAPAVEEPVDELAEFRRRIAEAG